MKQDGALAQSLVTLVAGVIFVASMAGILYVSSKPPDEARASTQTVQQSQAASILDMLSQSPGVGMEAGSDGYQRFSIMDSDGERLSHDVAGYLCRAAYGPDHSDGRIDYVTVARSLGLDPEDGIRFHLSLTPAEIPEIDFSSMKTAYVGQKAPDTDLIGPGITTAQVSYGATYDYPGGTYVQQLNSQFSTTALSERTTIEAMGMDHKPMPDAYGSSIEGTVGAAPASNIFDEDVLHGDQYFDDATYLAETLAGRLQIYDLLIIGTNVNHTELSPLANAADAWVRAGGTLLILGTGDATGSSKSPTWLASLIEEDSPTPSGQDQWAGMTHPVFRSYYRLEPDHFKGSKPFHLQASGSLENILPTLDPHGSHLAVNSCGTLEDGTLVRLSYTDSDDLNYAEFQSDCVVEPPRRQLGQAAPCIEKNDAQYSASGSARALLMNLAAYGHHKSLYIDFGPPIPAETATAHQMRIIAYDHPVHGAMSMEAHIFAWRA